MGQSPSSNSNGGETNSSGRSRDTDRSKRLVAKYKERSVSSEQIARGDYVVGMGHYVLHPDVRVEAFDVWRSSQTKTMVFRWRPARIRKVHDDCVLVAFDGFSERWDAWFPLSEGKIRSPSHGPVVGPDGVLYPPKITTEDNNNNNENMHVAAAPVSSQPLLPRRPPLIRSRRQVVKKKRYPSLLFKKTSRSSSSSSGSEQEKEEGDDELLNDEGPHLQGNDIPGQVTFRVDDDDDVGDNAQENDMHQQYPNRLVAKISRTVSSTSSLVVETGDMTPPPRTSTPPAASSSSTSTSGAYYHQFFSRWSGTDLGAKKNHGDRTTTTATSSDEGTTPSVLVHSTSNNSLPMISGNSTTTTNNNNGISATTNNRGISGLVNLGNTCFMNAVLQSLSHIPPFVERMLRDVKPLTAEEQQQQPQPQRQRGSLTRSDRLARVLCTLVRDQWKPNPDRSRRPHELKRLIAEIAPQFQGHRQQDAQELLVCLLDGLHDALNRIHRRPTYVEMDPPKDLPEAELSSLYWDNYERGNDSFIKDLFCGQLMSRVTCSVCNKASTSFDVFWDLSLQLPVRDKPIHLSDLLKTFCDVERMGPDCGFRCESCGKATLSATKQLTIARQPRVLVLHLKRFSHEKTETKKICTPVTFPLKGLRFGDETYDLVSVVNHFGSFHGGHYTADVYNPMTKAWWSADDANFGQAARVGTNAYILFYVESSRCDRVKSWKALAEMSAEYKS